MKEIIDTYAKNAFQTKATTHDKDEWYHYNYDPFFPKNLDAQVLDIGPGMGEMLITLRQQGYHHIYAVDISISTIDHCQKLGFDCECVPNTQEWLHAHPNQFQLITLLDVIEHIDKEQLVDFLRACCEALTDNGCILIQTPNLQAPEGFLHRYNDITHYVGFIEHTMDQVLSVCGFEAYHNYPFEEWVRNDPDTRERKKIRRYYWDVIQMNRRLTHNLTPEILTPVFFTVAYKKQQYAFFPELEGDGDVETISLEDLLSYSKKNIANPIILSEIHNNKVRTQEIQNTITQTLCCLTKEREDLLRREQNLTDRIEALAFQTKNQASHIKALTSQMEEQVTRTTALSSRIEEQIALAAELRQILRNKEGHIELLLKSDRELEHIKASRSWHMMGYVWKLERVLIPPGSYRRLLCKVLAQFATHPLRFISKCTPKRIGKFFKSLSREGALMASKRLDNCLIKNELPEQKLFLDQPPAGFIVEDKPRFAIDYEKIYVPYSDKPLVSIIIPVYNQFYYTYACIKSIVQHSNDVSYEILLADDCSTDLTKEIDNIITGLHIIRPPQNLRFLRNCNHAAKEALGRYLLFLNNDTQVQPDWLASLVHLMEQDNTIGMTGSKLVYPDGRLQEAGGIIWQDASAWNYGNRSDPMAPEYNYVKEVDYISGASICIRKTLWDEIGGFDDQFAPAYCEDSDLAFEVRARAFRVVYQPASVVVHFEGKSNGTDISVGQKNYQVINQKKFYKKWKNVLERDQFPNGENLFQARDRSRNKKVLLMVDHYVPQYDKDAGSRTVFAYLKLFATNGYQVKFIGDNFFPHQPYTQALQQLGIEVLYGPYYANHWKEWLRENGRYMGYAFLNRPHISVKYIDEVRQHTSARIIYYGHDLHFLRELREYELTRDKAILRSSKDWKEKELALMRKADMVYYPSCVEEKEIHAIDSSIAVKAIPAYLFPDVKDPHFKPAERRDLMFIGGFNHIPNVDAVKWLATKILPLLKDQLPSVKVHVLGSNPPQEIAALANETLQIEGFVTDEQLAEYYRTCRLAIVPLRYGAGIKGKVVEAMSYGMPVVTTSIGAEGIIGAENILSIANTPEAFVNAVVELYQNEVDLISRSTLSIQYILEHYLPENAKKVVGPDFDME